VLVRRADGPAEAVVSNKPKGGGLFGWLLKPKNTNGAPNKPAKPKPPKKPKKP
jgi:hypothetical protein